ncbi:MAG: serine hydrolase [Oscillospiraceae bacterium]|nr:serine hydrolase [Oscillospiraceae bacterium]
MKFAKRILPLLLCFVLILPLGMQAFADDYAVARPYKVTLTVNGKETRVRAYDFEYTNNVYISLKGLSSALNGTSKKFFLQMTSTKEDGTYFTIARGKTGLAASDAQDLVNNDKRKAEYMNIKRNRLFDGRNETRYYTLFSENDLYMNLIDIMLVFDLKANYLDENSIELFPDQPLDYCPEDLEESGFLHPFTGVLIGDADTGKILYSYRGVTPTAIASTTKLMTYLLVAEAMERGELDPNGSITISSNASAISYSGDGTIPLNPGQQIPVQELIHAMMLASSNESATALAEEICGSEDAFVERMNQRAQDLGLAGSLFYNSNGLPSFGESPLQTKRQNRMSAVGMFRLCQYILKNYPEITDITSLQFKNMPTMKYTTANSNPLVFNTRGVTGLKTGTTNKAGYCLVCSKDITVEDETHSIIAIAFGAETATERGQVCQLLYNYADRYYAENGF